MVKRVVLMLAVWIGWTFWQRAHGRSPEDPSTDDDDDRSTDAALAPLTPYASDPAPQAR